ncbi:TonB-dependent receptor plug domain-containing protein [Massilia scottii]|uniref:TonB-dependent receptor plug domain-containing protein n=1 Tax=Massilia scottii TaxID=3057166 RepID=UPI002796540D|nr:TonB-dependent receptor [Massilia sp. CCM 9029]MDQ1834527.1 TonB-dependent receptor [Massilia sp. CCM 9029]
MSAPALTVAAWVLMAAAAHAQQAPQAVVEVNASRDSYDARRDDTAGKIVVSREDMVRYGDASVLDTLKRVPGVTISGGNAQLRGLGAGYTQILLNGERAPSGFSLDALAPESVERVEVVRAATADTSTRAIAGTINVILKRAVSKAQRDWKAGAGASSDMAEGKTSLNMSDPAGAFSYSFAANASRNTFRRPVTTVETGGDAQGRPLYEHQLRGSDVGNFNTLNLTPRLTWELDNGDILSWQSFIYANRLHYHSRYVATYVTGAPRIDPLTGSVTSTARRTIRSDVAWTRKLGDSARLESRIGIDAGNYATALAQSSQAASGTLTLDRFADGLSRDRALRGSGKYSGRAGGAHTIGAGWEGSVARNTSDRQQADFGLAATPERYRADIRSLALYAQDEWTVSPQWSVYLGARWEGIGTRSGGSGLANVRNDSSVVSPILHTLYKLPGGSGDQVRMALTRTFKTPDAARLIARPTLTINNSASNPDSTGNPDLRPELALGIDAAYEHHWAKGALLSVSAAARRIEDCTVQALNQTDGRWVLRPENGGQCDVRTLEVETRFPLQSVAPGAPPLDLRLSVSRNWSAVDQVPGPDNRLAEQVPLSATAGIDYKLGALTTGASFVYSSGGHARLSQDQFTFASARRDLEMYGLWKLDSKLQLRVSIANALRHDWISDRSYAGAAGTYGTRATQPGKTWVRAMLEARF